MPQERLVPRTFYLNEQHELSRGEKQGGGRVPHFVGIDWATKGQALGESLTQMRQMYRASKDPLVDRHYFALAKPIVLLRLSSPPAYDAIRFIERWLVSTMAPHYSINFINGRIADHPETILHAGGSVTSGSIST